jgi:hypothetical protein
MQQFLALPELQVLKLGLAGCRHELYWPEHWAHRQKTILDWGKQMAAVIYADERPAAAPPAQDVLALARVEVVSNSDLASLLTEAQQAGMRTVVAGSLASIDLPHLADLPINVLAVRGAVCELDRTGRLSSDRVGRFREAIHAAWQHKQGHDF